MKDFGMEHFIIHKLETVKTSKFHINFYNSYTNLKIILISAPDAKNVKAKLNQVYVVYSKFLRNNSFYAVGLLEWAAD